MKKIDRKNAKAVFYLDIEEEELKDDEKYVEGESDNFLNLPGEEPRLLPKLNMTVKAKIIPEDIREQMFDFIEELQNPLLNVDELKKFLEDNTKYVLEDFEDFDRMKHMTEEERRKSDDMRITKF